MKTYKVVRTQNGEYRSAINRLDFNHGKYDLVYELGKETFPVEGTKLFVFTDIRYAKEFKTRVWSVTTPYCILEGEATNAEKFNWIGRMSTLISRFWKVKHFEDADCVSEAPHGTYVADSFTPMRIVK